MSKSPFKGLSNGKHLKMKTKIGSNGVESVSEEAAPLMRSAHVNSPIRNRQPPSDLCHATYFIFFLMGVGHLLPWNFFITAQNVSLELSLRSYFMQGRWGGLCFVFCSAGGVLL